jgi:hypothetical protein
MRVISLGWGVQSWALAAMSALGVLPAVDAAIHADTTHERRETYAFAIRWTPWLQARWPWRCGLRRWLAVRRGTQRAVRVLTVSGGRRLMGLGQNGDSYTSIPAFTRSAETFEPTGMLRRQCTHDWKLLPLRKAVRAELARRGLKLSPGLVEQWLGITLDEIQRVKPSGVQYIVNRYPFIEMFDPPMRRGMVIQWLRDNGLEVPVKSACVFCPYHDKATWRQIKLGGNGDWRKAVAVDEAIRHTRPGYVAYVARERRPLAEIDYRNQVDHGQLPLWSEECEGMCFL